MLDEGNPELVISFPYETGTTNLIKMAKKLGIKVIDIQWESNMRISVPFEKLKAVAHIAWKEIANAHSTNFKEYIEQRLLNTWHVQKK